MMTAEYSGSSLIPRPGIAGFWDRLVGPGSTRFENSLILATAAAGALYASVLAAFGGYTRLQIAVAALIAFDIFGGAIANATETTKRWYHRPGMTRANHLGYIAAHVLHILVVSRVFLAGDWVFFLVFTFYLITGSLLILAAPAHARRPLAAALYIIAVLLSLHVPGSALGLEWFVPVLFLKLLVGYCVPEISAVH